MLVVGINYRLLSKPYLEIKQVLSDLRQDEEILLLIICELRNAILKKSDS